ncbi:hypothetical protein TCAL_16279, partial [Tigriopus californicus]
MDSRHASSSSKRTHSNPPLCEKTRALAGCPCASSLPSSPCEDHAPHSKGYFHDILCEDEERLLAFSPYLSVFLVLLSLSSSFE